MNEIQIYHKEKQAIQKQTLQKSNTKHEPIDSLVNNITEIFSSFWNIMRFVLFILVAGYVLILSISIFSAIPPGESLSIEIVIKTIAKHFKFLKEKVPIFEFISERVAALVSSRQLNFLIFLGSLLGTTLLLMCFCSR